jgi:uncharacterized membrane protein
MKKNVELRAMARAQLEGTWLAAVGMRLVYHIILGISSIIGAGPLIIGGPLELGYRGYFLKKSRGEAVKLENLFDGFKQFGSSFLLYLLKCVFIILWSCLLIIPGIVKSFSYAMAFYIMRDHPDIGAFEAIARSRKMMDGYKAKLFGLYVSFIGWALLCCLPFGITFLGLVLYIVTSATNPFGLLPIALAAVFTPVYISFIGGALLCGLLSGIGFLWLFPYIDASVTNFYEELKKHNAAAIQNANTEAAYDHEEKKVSPSEDSKSAQKTSAAGTNESRKKVTVSTFNNGIYKEDEEFQYSNIDGKIFARDKATKLTYYVLKNNNWLKII